MGPSIVLKNNPKILKSLKKINISSNKVEKLNHNIIIQRGRVPNIIDVLNL